jgi:predicted DNA-binding protein
MKKIYESKKVYSDKYNKSHKSIRIKKELYERLQHHIDGKDITIKDYIELLIEKSIK